MTPVKLATTPWLNRSIPIVSCSSLFVHICKFISEIFELIIPPGAWFEVWVATQTNSSNNFKIVNLQVTGMNLQTFTDKGLQLSICLERFGQGGGG